MDSKTCTICESTFVPVNERQRYCGQPCAYRANLNRSRANRKAGQPTVRTCVGCSVVMVLVRTLGNLRRLCDGCRDEAHRRQRRAHRKKRDARKRGVTAHLVTPEYVYERDQWRCQLCKRKVPKDKTVPHPKAATLDHVVPLAEGGEHTNANVQLAHFECNWRKGSAGTQQLALIG